MYLSTETCESTTDANASVEALNMKLDLAIKFTLVTMIVARTKSSKSIKLMAAWNSYFNTLLAMNMLQVPSGGVWGTMASKLGSNPEGGPEPSPLQEPCKQA